MLRHVCIEVKNMPVELVAGFYQETFGMKIVYRGREKWLLGTGAEVTLDIIKLKMPGTRTLLELIGHRDEWLPHICLEVDKWPENVHLMELKRLDKEHKNLEVRFCLDPSGNMIELVRREKK